MIGLVVCGVLAACNSLKTTTDKLYQRIDYYCMLIYAQFNFARYQTTLFVEFWFRKNRTAAFDKTRLYIYSGTPTVRTPIIRTRLYPKSLDQLLFLRLQQI